MCTMKCVATQELNRTFRVLLKCLLLYHMHHVLSGCCACSYKGSSCMLHKGPYIQLFIAR